MSFYVTLPSNASVETYTSNTQSEFITILNPSIILKTNYEVALVELIMGDSFYNNIGTIILKNPYWKHFLNKKNVGNEYRKEFIFIDVNIHPNDSYESFFENLSDSINQTFIKEEYICRYNYYLKILNKQTFVIIDSLIKYELPVREYDSKDRTIEVIKEIEQFLRINKYIFKIVLYDKNNKIKVTNPTSIEFYGPILEIFNFKRGQYIGDFLKNINQFNLSVNSNIFVYTDIIYDQFVGNDMKPLLKIITLTNNNNSYIINQPQYYPVNKTILETIKIKLEYQNNQNIKFFSKFNKVIVKLHFKKIK